MRTIKNKISALVLGVCLLVSLALGGVAAFAAVEIDNDTINVKVTNDSTSEYYSDLMGADIDIKVYKIGDADPDTVYDTYNLTLDKTLFTKTIDEYMTTTGEPDWKTLGDDAKAAVTKAGTDPAGHVIKKADADSVQVTGLDDGVYLVLASGARDDGDMPHGKYFKYDFNPSVVTVPTKPADENGVIMTSNPGEWNPVADVILKPERLPIYGAIEIEKVIDGEVDDEDATFTFHLTGTAPQGDEYDNYASVTIPAGYKSGKTVVTHIPAGTELTVAEVYAAGRYDIKGEDITVVDKTTTVIADDTDDDQNHKLIRFSVKNKPNGDNYGGHGVENNFRYSDEEGDWVHEQTDKEVNKEEDLIVK